MSKKLFILLVLFSIQFYNVKSEDAFYPAPVFLSQEGDFFLHTVERGETIYAIAKMYNVKVEDINRLNPGSSSGIQAGYSLKIPQESGSYFYHTIQPKETLYSVSKQYFMTGEDIMKVNPGLSVETFTIGKVIRIPTNKVTAPLEGSEVFVQRMTNDLLNVFPAGENIRTIRVALLLPIGLKETALRTTGNRMIEYYEGVLLALEDLKKKGISIDLQIHDTGSKTDLLPSILKKPSMQTVHLVIGGLNEDQIQLISQFAKEKDIPYVIPFTSQAEEALSQYQVYQVNTPEAYRYSKASSAFCKKYKDSHIVFYINPARQNKMDFVQVLQKDLNDQNISYQVIQSGDPSTEIQKAIVSGKHTVFVPADDTSDALTDLIAPLKAFLEANPEASVSLFGYPTWQILGTERANDFSRLNVSFYSIFYANPTSSAVKSFYNRYLHWYSKEMINTYPKYGMLGYDTAMYFILLLNRYGTSYDVNINKVNYTGVQTDFYFERSNNWGGFINTNLYLVEFTPNFKIQSTQIK